MRQSFRRFIDKIKSKYPGKQSVFIMLAVFLFILLLWFSISNFVFLVDNLNKAFGQEIEAETQDVKFDREAFRELNLIQ